MTCECCDLYSWRGHDTTPRAQGSAHCRSTVVSEDKAAFSDLVPSLPPLSHPPLFLFLFSRVRFSFSFPPLSPFAFLKPFACPVPAALRASLHRVAPFGLLCFRPLWPSYCHPHLHLGPAPLFSTFYFIFPSSNLSHTTCSASSLSPPRCWSRRLRSFART